MKTRLLLPVLLLTLGGCESEAPSVTGKSGDAGDALDQQAIAAGLIPDPEELKLGGRFETRSELGTDKFCAVETGDNQFDIGVLAVFGSESKCEGRGRATADGEKLLISLSGKGNCSFEAKFDGIELRFPGTLESGCAAYCSDRASLSGTHYFMIQPGNDAASRTLGRDLERLCR